MGICQSHPQPSTSIRKIEIDENDNRSDYARTPTNKAAEKVEPLYDERSVETDFFNVKLKKHDYFVQNLWPTWRAQIKASPSKTLFIPGAMGSELWQADSDKVVYFNLAFTWRSKELLVAEHTETGLVDGIGTLYARDVVNVPFRGAIYDSMLDDDDVGIKAGRYCWDWREDKIVAAKRFLQFLKYCMEDEELASTGIHIVAHSDGCSVCLYGLGETEMFDPFINTITYIAPIFGGTINPLEICEYGNGINPAIDFLVPESTVQEIVISFPGTFQQLIAPREYSVLSLPTSNGEGEIDLTYPVKADSQVKRQRSEAPPSPFSDNHDHQADFVKDLYHSNSFHTNYSKSRRDAMLVLARRFHNKMFRNRHEVPQRPGLKGKINVIVGLNGKTQFLAEQDETNVWLIHSFSDKNVDESKSNLLFNGDGMALLQSSYLPGVGADHHWAYVPERGEYSHSDLCQIKQVHDTVKTIIRTGTVSEDSTALLPYRKFIDMIDFSWELENPPECACPASFSLDYLSRARLRQLREHTAWPKDINPLDSPSNLSDADLLEKTHKGTLEVLRGRKLLEVAEEMDIHPRVLQHHILRLIAPPLSFNSNSVAVQS